MLAFVRGFIYFFESFAFISKHSLWKHVLKICAYSLLLGLLIFGLLYKPGVWLFDWLIQFYPWERGKNVLETLSSILLVVFLLVGFVISFRTVTYIVLSPMMSALARKVERIVTDGQCSERNPRFSIVREIWRGFRINTRNLVREAIIGIVLSLFALIPGLAILAGPAFIIVQAYYIGFGSLDYYLEKYYDIKESVNIAFKSKYWLTGIGAAYLLTVLLPFVGIFLAPSLAVVSSTRMAINKGI